MTETRRDDNHQVLLVDETNAKSNINQKNLGKSTKRNKKTNQKSNFDGNDRVIMILLGILGLIILIILVLTIILFFNCHTQTKHSNHSLHTEQAKENNTKTTNGILFAENNSQDNQNQTQPPMMVPKPVVGRSRSGLKNRPPAISD